VSDEVLRYALGLHQNTVKRAYSSWRVERGIPERCDNEKCRFHTEPLIWNGEPFKLILDHKDGVKGDNRPECLRFLCPLCNAQLSTHGGGNKGRVEMSAGGFAIKEDGVRQYTLPIESTTYEWNAGDVVIQYEEYKEPNPRERLTEEPKD
jgi:hypothetical protein